MPKEKRTSYSCKKQRAAGSWDYDVKMDSLVTDGDNRIMHTSAANMSSSSSSSNFMKRSYQANVMRRIDSKIYDFILIKRDLREESRFLTTFVMISIPRRREDARLRSQEISRQFRRESGGRVEGERKKNTTTW